MSATSYQIRSARQDDAQGIAGLLQGIGWFKAYQGRSSAENTQAVKALLNSLQAPATERGLLLIAHDEQQRIHGYCAVHWLPVAVLQGWEAYLSELFVAEAARGEGLGQQLLDTATQAARERGCLRIWLVNNRERPSYVRGFYSRQGWSDQAEMARFVLPLHTTNQA